MGAPVGIRGANERMRDALLEVVGSQQLEERAVPVSLVRIDGNGEGFCRRSSPISSVKPPVSRSRPGASEPIMMHTRRIKNGNSVAGGCSSSCHASSRRNHTRATVPSPM